MVVALPAMDRNSSDSGRGYVVPSLDHRGPQGWPRVQAVRSRAVPVLRQLRPGERLADELLRLCAETGAEAGFAELFGGSLAPLHYCVPDGPDEERCVSFSEERVTAHGDLLLGSATIGRRQGKPFVHAHLHWTDEQGRPLGGHIWPDTVVGSPAPTAAVFGLPDAAWTSRDDPETSMPTFTPSVPDRPQEDTMTDLRIPDSRPGQAPPVTVARLLPNQDITEAVVGACREAGIRRAVVRAGLGSLIGARFRRPDGSVAEVDGPGTEVISLTGFVEPTGAQLTCTLVDRHGQVCSGLLIPGQNPVAVTFELTLQPVPAEAEAEA